MGRTYSGRNAESVTGYKLVRNQLRGRQDLTAPMLAVIAMYAKAQDEPGKAVVFKAAAAEHAASLTSQERAIVNSVLADAGIGGLE